MEISNAVETYWKTYLEKAALPKDTPLFDVFAFGSGEAMAQELLELVLAGKKRATTGAVASYEYEGIGIPQVGNHSVVTDYAGVPRCIIRTTSATTLPFKDVTWEMAKREGEDEVMDTWREGHIRYFNMDAEEAGYTFTEDILVVFEDFEVVYQ